MAYLTRLRLEPGMSIFHKRIALSTERQRGLLNEVGVPMRQARL
jgi:hypothetical protein